MSNSTDKYEAHITCTRANKEAAEQVAKEWKWKTSEIARDIVLGDDTFFYLTKHFPTLTMALDTMHVVNQVLTGNHVNILRNKVELVVYDVRTVNGKFI